MGKILDGARIVGKIRLLGLLLNTWRDPVCDGAMLLGDAGLHVDPLFGQGHSFALISAEIFGELAPSWLEASQRRGDHSRHDERIHRAGATPPLMPYYHASLKVSQHLGLDPEFAARASGRESRSRGRPRRWCGSRRWRTAKIPFRRFDSRG